MEKKICSVPYCGEPMIAKGYCSKHWRQNRVTGATYSTITLRCRVPGCGNEHAAKGYCLKHYTQVQRRGAVHSMRTFTGCSAPRCSRPHFGFGYCEKHLDQIQKNGHLLKVGRDEPNEVFFDGEIARIIIHRKKKAFETVIDREDYEKVKGYRWNIAFGYVVSTSKDRSGSKVPIFRLHRIIMGLDPGRYPEVDHRDRDRLNNRKDNLRICARANNCWNKGPRKDSKSGINGVTWDRSKGAWRVRIHMNKRVMLLGTFDKLEDAAIVRRNAEIKHYGEFAPIEEPTILSSL